LMHSWTQATTLIFTSITGRKIPSSFQNHSILLILPSHVCTSHYTRWKPYTHMQVKWIHNIYKFSTQNTWNYWNQHKTVTQSHYA
jgi:hypothetical protein